MAVVLPDRTLRVRTHAHPVARDAYGAPVTPDTGAAPVYGPALPGAAKEKDGDDKIGREWSLRLDPAHWPVTEGDLVTDGEKVWALMHPIKHVTIPGYPDVDYVAATGLLQDPELP